MWNDLSLNQKADLFKIYAANGYTSLDSIKEHYNSFADGGEKDTIPMAIDEEGNLIDTINPSVIKARRKSPSFISEGKKLIKSLKSNNVSGILESAPNVFNKLPRKVRERTIEVALRANHTGGGAETALEEYIDKISVNSNLLKKDIQYILTGNGVPSINNNDGLYHYRDREGIFPIKGKKIENDIIDAVAKGIKLNPNIALQVIGEKGYGIEDSYINKNYPGREVQYVQTNPPEINYSQEGITSTNITGSAGEFVTSNPQVRIDNAGIVLEYGNRNDSTFVRGWDVYDFASPDGDKSGYITKWGNISKTNNGAKDETLIRTLDKNTYPLVIRTPWVYEGDINKIIKATGGYLNNLTYKPFSYSPIPQVRYADGGPKQSFRRWSKAISDYKGIDVKHDNTYDYRGFYNDNPDYAYSMLGEDLEAHFPDTWKTPKHPTFSDESIYSTDKKQGGHWVELPNGGWEFQHSDYTFDHSDETNQYLRENDPSSYATYRGGIVLDGELHGLNETKAKVFAPFYGGTFEEAFSKARDRDKNFFRWKGNLYNTRLAPSLSDSKPAVSSNLISSEDFNVLDDIVNRIKTYENSKDSLSGGYNKTRNVWYPHDSPEGGAKTIGYGIKLSNGSKWAELANTQGYLTDAQVEEAARDLASEHLENSRKIFNKRFGEGAFEALDPKMQSILTDFDYNPGLSTFPNLMKAVYENNIEGIYKEYKRYLNGKELGRNRGIKAELDEFFQK